MRDDRGRLEDILLAIDKIERAVGGKSQQDFDQDEMLQVWSIYHLQIIGEAVSRLSEDFLKRTPDAPWRKAIGMRHILVHQYFGIDKDIVWGVIEQELQPLKTVVSKALSEI
ncbi:MAG: DUF86 domain-containing protein [Anaerolineae bacterium]|nr:MAG: DUF86 domain-containing protein [Anaerolineae bacterium]